jgi:hypothetical protein
MIFLQKTQKRSLTLFFSFLFGHFALGQTFYLMSSGDYSQDFSNISAWTNNYASGTGSENWRVASSVATSNPNATNVFVSGTSGGVQKGTNAMILLATGTNRTATDLLLNFTGRNAGTISLDWAKVENSVNASPRSSDLKIQYSIDNGVSFTDLTGYTLPRVFNNNTPESGSLTSIALPSALNNQSQVVIRFFVWNNGQSGGSGNRPKFEIDNISITSTASASPVIALTPGTLSGFNYTVGQGPSSSQIYNASGSNLTGSGNIVISAPANFEISTNNSSFSSSINLPFAGGVITSQPVTIYARMVSGLGAGAYNGSITHTGGGAPQANVTVDGSVVLPLGWQINAVNTVYTIDFDNTVSGVNNGQFDCSGFTNTPSTGQINSQSWAVTGWTDGALAFGGAQTTGDFARGSSNGGVSTGGTYAFQVSTGNYALGFQPGSSDWAPGSATLKMQNQTGSAIASLYVSYKVYVYNDQGRSNSFNFSYSDDDVSYTNVSELDLISAAVADGSPSWKAYYKVALISGLNVSDGDYFYLRWSGADVGGSGSRDEFALDDISVNVNPSGAFSVNGTCEEFLVGSSASVVLNPSTSLIVNNNIVNNGTVTIENDAQLVQTATTNTNSGAGTYVVKRTGGNNSSEYNIWSSPVTNQNILGAGGVFTGSNPCDIYVFDASNQKWRWPYAVGFSTTCMSNPITFQSQQVLAGHNGNMLPGWGYFAPGAASSTRQFLGTINNGDIVRSMQLGSNNAQGWDDWNLLGNPYPSSLNINAFINGNSHIQNGVHYYDASLNSGNGGYITVNNTDNDFAASGQGFWVVATSAHNANFTNAMRSASVSSFRSSNDVPVAYFSVGNTLAKDQTRLYLDEMADDAWDNRFDVSKLDNPAGYTFASKIQDQKLAIQSIVPPAPNQFKITRLFLEVFDAGVHTIRLDSIKNWNNVGLFLIDYYSSDTINIATNSYSFSSDSAQKFDNRFALLVGLMPQAILPLEGSPETVDTNAKPIETSLNTFNNSNYARTYIAGENLVFESNKRISRVEIYSVNGQLVYQNTLSSSLYILNNVSRYCSGVCIISMHLENGEIHRSKAVIHD